MSKAVLNAGNRYSKWRFAFLALFGLCSGCLMTKGDGDDLRAELVQRMQQQDKKNREEIDQKLKELQSLIDRATQVLEHSSADVGAQVSSMNDQLSTALGQIDELQHRIDDLQQQLLAQRSDIDQQLQSMKPGTKPALDPSQIPSDKQAHFQAAYDAYAGGDYDKARALWTEYLKRYAADAKAGDAQYWIGASFTQQQKPATALGEYQKVIRNYPKSNAVNVALYGMGDAFYQLHACTDAKTALQALIKRKPDAALSERTKKLLKTIEKPPKGYCTS